MKQILAKAIVVTLVLAAFAVVAPVAFAGQNVYVKAAVHLQVPPMICPEIPAFNWCSDINFTYYSFGDVVVVPVLFDLDCVTSAGIGLDWPPEWGSMIWIRCSGDGGVGSITNPGDGTAIAWSACYCPGNHSLAPGYGLLTTASVTGLVYPVYNFPGGPLGVYDCTPPSEYGPFFDTPIAVYGAGVGIVGDDACAPVGTTSSTWGSVKALLK